MEFSGTAGLISLFMASFLSATLLPGGAEIGFLAMLNTGTHPPIVLLCVATLGNSLGGLFTFYMGRLGRLDVAERFLRIPKDKVLSYEKKVGRYGNLLSFFCFLPLIGDPLALALGYFKVPVVRFFMASTAGKLVRFLGLYAAFRLI